MAAPRQPRKKQAAPDAPEGLRRPLSPEALRRQAEERLAVLADAALPTPEELTAAVHELRVHQIELEMQNEELRRAQFEADALRAKYADLFHLAPVGYFTLSEKGIVGEANLTAAGLLGVEQRRLVGQPFSVFVLAADRKKYYGHLELMKKSAELRSCELRLQPVGAEPFWAQLEGQPQVAADGEPFSYHLTFTDVHKRVLAEEALRHREEQLARAVEGSGVGLWDWYPQTGEETFNERWAEILGYTLDELAPTSIETWRSLTHPDDLQRSDELLEAHFRGESETYEYEARMRHKDGHWVWELDRGKVSEWDADGRPLRMIGTGLDISARKQAEEALRESEEHYRGLFQQMSEGYALCRLVYDPDGEPVDFVYLEVNDAFGRITGLHDAEGRPVSEVIPGGIREANPEYFEMCGRVVLTGAPEEIELDVQLLHQSLRISLYRPEPGHFVSVFTDISARKHAEEALRQAADRLTLAARAGGVGVWEYDVDDDVLIWDEQMFALYGITREQFGGAYEAWQAGLHPDDRERGDAEIQMALRGEKEFDTEFRVLWPDGTIRSIRALALVQRDASGRATHMIGTNWDVTAQRQREEELKSSEANFRTLFETVDDVIVVSTPDGRVVYANPAVSHKLGYSVVELAEMHVLDLYAAEERDEAVEIFAAVLTGERDNCPLPLQSKSGALIPAETRAWSGQWGGAECIFGVSKDRTREQEALLYAQAQEELLERRQAEEALARSAAQLREQLHDTVKTMGAIVSLRDPYTAAHERRVTELAMAIALEMGLGEEAREGIAFAAEVHDVGKVGVPAEILSKPAALSDLEFTLIKQHPQAGRELLAAIRFRQPVAEIVGQHHERLDGSGYPDGLKGEEILPEARILSVADVVEAMASHRPYRSSLGLPAALAEVRGGAGTRYDGDVVAACEQVFAQGFAFTEE